MDTEKEYYLKFKYSELFWYSFPAGLVYLNEKIADLEYTPFPMFLYLKAETPSTKVKFKESDFKRIEDVIGIDDIHKLFTLEEVDNQIDSKTDLNPYS